MESIQVESSDKLMMRRPITQRELSMDRSRKGTSWLIRASSRGDRQILLRAGINFLGAALFFVGSLGWVARFPMTGTFLFAGSNIFCYCVTGVWWSLSARASFQKKYASERLLGFSVTYQPGGGDALPMHPGLVQTPASDMPAMDTPDIVRAFRVLTHMEMMAAFWQVAGAVAFTIGCFTSLNASLGTETILFWLSGSFFFVIQAMMSQIICESFWGPLLPIAPRFRRIVKHQLKRPDSCCTSQSFCLHRCVPGALLNWLGSVIFTIASVCLFYDKVEVFGGWGYLIGSGMFVIAAFADINGFLDALAFRLVHQEQLHYIVAE